ncbi:MAG TPA: 30S ribosomal protein S6 [Spirochaetota bacterium]|nr:30S ribosomal protein S6 [Spirochaetota bacterium]HOM38194.1 30S ribosomal protein S6 [Spirochaetota bacterium]HPQ48588.1 30S ribosomal protein S6 [Spirochaetota bacterium]
MKKYEVMVIFDTRVETTVIKEWFINTIKEKGGTIDSEKDMGIKKLAYPIDKKDKGIYYLFYVNLEPTQLSKVYKDLNLKEEIVRYIFIKKEK